MPRRLHLQCGIIVILLLWGSVFAHTQNITTPAPDGSPSAQFDSNCVFSDFFQFSYALPEGMQFDDMSHAPGGGVDATRRTYVIFMSHRDREMNRNMIINRDVINVAAEDRRMASDESGASWMRALHRLNVGRKDVPIQGEVEQLKIGGRDLAKLEFQQSRDDGVITYEAAYAFGANGYVVYFIFGSVDRATLGKLEQSMNSIASADSKCRVGR